MRGAAIAFRGTERFELVAELGSGSMGTVYKVFDRETDSYAALKLLENYSDDALRRFKREFRSIQGVQHPNLVNLGELAESRGVWFITMELVDGPDFLAYVAPGGVLDEDRLRHATVGLARGLEALHRANKVHRDVKPSNVLVDRGGRVVLLDFGLILEADNPEQSAMRAAVVGTGAYMAPDSVDGGARAAPASDWYGVGVMLYEALTGQLPHTGTVVEIMIKKREREPRPPSQLRPGVAGDLESLCIDLLSRDPAVRPGGAEILRRLGADRDESAEEGGEVVPAFVGRARELERLLEGLRPPRDAVTMLVEGTSGVGKSTLVRRFEDHAAERHGDAIILPGRCFEREAVPFKGVDGVVDALARHLAARDDVAAVLPDNSDLLVRVFPALGRLEAFRETTRASHGDVGPHELRRRAFVALRVLLGRLAKERPVIVVIDDIQWMSSDSWALLEQLTQPPAAPPVMLVLTRRPATGKLHPIPGAVDQIELGPLPPHEARELATELLHRANPGAAADTRAAQIAREAGGHPLFIQQLVEHVAAGGDASGARLEQALAARVSRLSPAARELLQLIATAAAPMPHACMAHALLVDFAEYQRRVSELQAGNFARTVGMRAADTVVHYHDRIRDAALAGVSDDTQKRLHLRLANAIEEVGLAERAPQLAVHHLAAAGLRERAAYHAESAAKRAMEMLAFEPAAALFWIALDLGAYEGAARRALELRLADALVHAGRGTDAAALYLEAAQSGTPAERLDCQRLAADQLLLSGHLADGTNALEAVLAHIGESMPRTPRRALASLIVQRALLRVRGLRWRRRDESAIAPADLVRLDVYQTVATGLTFVDNIRGADFQCRFLRMALTIGEPTRVIRALSFEAAFHATLGHRRRTRALLDQLAASARDASPVAQAYERLAVAACGTYLHNDWPATMRAAQQAGHLLRNHTQTGGWETNTARLFKCFSLLHMGKLEHLARLVPVYVREAERRGDLYASTTLRSRLVLPWLVADDPVGALSDLEEAMQRWTPWREQYLVQHFFALHSLSEIALYRGDAAAAMAHVHEQLPPLKRSLLLRLWMPRGEVDHLRGRIALARKDTDAARRFARSLRGNRLPAPRGWGLLLEAGAANLDGDEAGAARLLVAAVEALEPGNNAMYRNAAAVALGQDRGREWLASEQVANPAALCRLLVPGFPYAKLT